LHATRLPRAPNALFGLVGQASGLEELSEPLEVRGGHVAKLPPVALGELGRDLIQELETGLRDVDADHATVVGRALSRDQPAVGELVEHPRDVGGPRHQAVRESERRDGIRALRTKDSKRVVLLRRQSEAPEELVLEDPQAIVGPPKVEEDLLLEGVESEGASSRDTNPWIVHARHCRWLNDTCPDKF